MFEIRYPRIDGVAAATALAALHVSAWLFRDCFGIVLSPGEKSLMTSVED